MYRVFVADDEPLIRKRIIACLKECNLPVDVTGEAINGAKAIDMISDSTPHIIITDIKMPVMDGLELIKNVKALYPEIRFIVISGYAEFEYAKQAMSFGVSDYILKPVKDEDLLNAINKNIEYIKSIEDIQNVKVNSELIKEENAAIQRELFFNKAISNDAAITVLAENLSFLKGICHSCFKLIIIKLHGFYKCNEASKHLKQDIEPIKFSVKKALKKIIMETGNAIPFDNLNKRSEILLCLFDKSESKLQWETDLLLNKLLSNLKDDRCTNFTIGISSTGKNINSMSKLYEEASSSINFRFEDGGTPIYYYEKNKLKENFILPHSNLKKLYSGMETSNLSNVRLIIDEIFDRDLISNYSTSYVKFAFQEIMSLLIKYCNSCGISTYEIEEMITPDYLDNFYGLKELKESIYAIIEKNMKASAGFNISGRNIIHSIKDYIENNFNEELNLKDFAAKYNISQGYLSHMFRDALGISFTDYIYEMRMKAAKKYLMNTEMSASEVAAIVGYNEPQYFYKLFKRYTGMTPSEYRESSKRL